MSVNICGTTNKNDTSSVHETRGQPSIGFKIFDVEGNFDIDNKRLPNLSEPVDNNDAITKAYVNNIESMLKILSTKTLNTKINKTKSTFKISASIL